MKLFADLKRAFHGEGHKYYKTKEAKLAFAKTLLNISNGLALLFFATVASLPFLGDDLGPFVMQICISFTLLAGAVWGRHEALLVIDETEGGDKELAEAA